MLGSIENSSLWACGFLFFVLVQIHLSTTMDREVFQNSRLFQRPFHLRAKMQQSQGRVLILLSMVNQVKPGKTQVKPIPTSNCFFFSEVVVNPWCTRELRIVVLLKEKAFVELDMWSQSKTGWQGKPASWNLTVNMLMSFLIHNCHDLSSCFKVV